MFLIQNILSYFANTQTLISYFRINRTPQVMDNLSRGAYSLREGEGRVPKIPRRNNDVAALGGCPQSDFLLHGVPFPGFLKAIQV